MGIMDVFITLKTMPGRVLLLVKDFKLLSALNIMPNRVLGGVMASCKSEMYLF
jgi:hypothetical protein